MIGRRRWRWLARIIFWDEKVGERDEGSDVVGINMGQRVQAAGCVCS